MASSISQDRQRALGSSHIPGYPSTSMHGYPQATSSTVPSGFGMGPAGQGLNDSYAQSRPQYQPGYLLSLAQSQVLPVAGQRHEEPLLLPTRAKTSAAYSRSFPSDFGSDSMFESTSSKHRHRETSDEDGPPTSSVVDLVTEIYQQRQTARRPGASSKPNRPRSPPAQQYQILFVVVFGFPLSKYSTTVAHFQGIAEGGCTEAERHADVENAFKIGFKLPWEAARACRWNGEILSGEGGRWMIGVKWLDPVIAEQVLGIGASISSLSAPGLGAETPATFPQERFEQNTQVEYTDASQQAPTHSVGTPITLVPSSSAFRKATPALSRKESPFQVPPSANATPAKSKGMLGQVSDLIFGW